MKCGFIGEVVGTRTMKGKIGDRMARRDGMMQVPMLLRECLEERSGGIILRQDKQQHGY